ncbi:MAG: methylmalonyl-CoA epimerase, partial [Blastococcus sp.]|nr:methylmalonyl-CoA epimerase [Blastococcus sp.]
MTTNDAPSSGLPEGLFTTIDHVGIAVPDLDEA